MKPSGVAAGWGRTLPEVHAPRFDAGKISILMVDDQPANLLALEALLKNDHYTLIKASSGREALRLMLRQDFALVLLDVFMPSMNGFETAELMRSRTHSSQTPIIFITAGSNDETHVARGYSLGAVDYIYKPIVPEILRAKVQVFVELFNKTASLARGEAESRRELAERIKIEGRLRESESRYRGLFSSFFAAVVIFDSDGGVLDANQAALKLYGYSRKEFLSLSAQDLGPAESDKGLSIISNAADSRRHTFIRDQKRSDGKLFPAEMTTGAFRIRGRKMVMLLARDITERRKAEEAERLREKGEMQRRLVATVSHELRTPIAAIKASAETLRNGVDDDNDRDQFVRIIDDHSGRLGFLVEDLLTVAELESGKSRVEPAAVDLAGFMREFVKTMLPLASRKGLSIEIAIVDGLELWVDQAHLARIFQNLVDNAIKYNKQGGSVRVEGWWKNKRQAQISVRDTGIGIPEKDLARVFEQFHRAEKARKLFVRGTGLGLYIIKSIVESNGGQIWAESVDGSGSAFHVVLPLAAAARQGKDAAAEG